MFVTELGLENFRNIGKIKINPGKNINIIYGENGYGKTNLIEAIYICTGLKNFRNAGFREWMQFEKNEFNINLKYTTKRRDNKIDVFYKKQKKENFVFKNDVKVPSIYSLAGNFLGVVFTPSHLDLVTGGPEERRSFLNYAIGQTKPHYIDLIDKYEKTLSQRNALLRDLKNKDDTMMLQVWNESISGFGAAIIGYRSEYITRLKKYGKEFYRDISDNRDSFSLKYNSSIKYNFHEEFNIEKINDIYLKSLDESFSDDVNLGYTSKGVHRDDISFILNNKSLRSFGSQGQKRSAVLALKLAESKILEEETNEKPVIFLDDILSELDEKRQEYILNNLTDRQIFITCCDKNLFSKIKRDKIYHMKNGIIYTD